MIEGRLRARAGQKLGRGAKLARPFKFRTAPY